MDKAYKQLINTFCDINNSEEMRNFLKEILTDKERESIALRWQLMKDLHSGKSQREIAKKYHMSLCKITRGSKILKKENSISKRYIQNSNNPYNER